MTFITMLKDESGASAAEYALILGIVGAGIAFSAVFLGDEINKAVTGAGQKICPDTDSICATEGTTAEDVD